MGIKVEKRGEITYYIKKTAEICGVSERHVRFVVNGERENETILKTYMELNEGANKLIQSVKKLVQI